MIESNDIFTPLSGNSFRFRCHPGISCFNECCAALQLVLTPYDVLRLKNRLGMTSGEFLDAHTKTFFERPERFPIIRLRMLKNEKESCPFVSLGGCTVYSDRPGACRFYPIGRAVISVGGSNTDIRNIKEDFFIVREAHCRGFEEYKEWKLDEWIKNESIEEYNRINDRWFEIVTSGKGMGDECHLEKKLQMYMMACYNLEEFKSFVFKSSFFDHFTVSDDEKAKIEQDEKELLLFGLKWLRFSLYGEKTMRMKGC